ncbi:MAG TPA: DUF998 domain-containing protein [Anaerolineales bacterium]|nr:DUF998 domain-containing protein [Anaerolineales bacterium]
MMNQQTQTSKNIFAWAGILAPILYFSIVVFLGLLEPGYNQRTMMMSVLGGVPGWRGAAFNLGLVLIGIFLIAFGVGMVRSIHASKGKRLGLALLVIASIGLIGSSYFHCEEGCVNILQEPDFRGQMHMLFAFFAGLGLAFSPLPFFFSMKGDPQWENSRGLTLTAVFLANIPGITMWITLFTTRLPEWEGLIQRLGLLFPLIWVEVMALKLLRISGPGQS